MWRPFHRNILADTNVKLVDKTFEKVIKAFASMFYSYHWAEMARGELNNLRQVETKKDDRFQQYLFKFQNLVAQS